MAWATLALVTPVDLILYYTDWSTCHLDVNSLFFSPVVHSLEVYNLIDIPEDKKIVWEEKLKNAE